MGQAKTGEEIYQPGRPDLSELSDVHIIATLSNSIKIAKLVRNKVDSALAILVDGMVHESNKIPTGLDYPLEGQMIVEADDDASMLE